MPSTNPTPCAFGALQYHPGSTSLVLVNTGNYPAYLQPAVNTWTWNGTNWTLTQTGIANNPSERTGMGMAYDGTNLALFGGKGPAGTGYMNDTWAWNGSAWTNPIANDGYNNGLTIRTAPYMAAMSGGVVLFGGKDYNHTLNDTWIWNGSSWALQSPAASPSIRLDAAFASNGTNKAVIFGGANGSYALNDAWSWNGTTWTLLATNTPPCVRKGAVMAWYPTGSYFLLFGGSDSNGNLLNDTWTFDGTSTWTKLTPAGFHPSVRVGAMMAYDTSSSQMILFGGKDSKNLLNDTWTWNGSVWIKL